MLWNTELTLVHPVDQDNQYPRINIPGQLIQTPLYRSVDVLWMKMVSISFNCSEFCLHTDVRAVKLSAQLIANLASGKPKKGSGDQNKGN